MVCWTLSCVTAGIAAPGVSVASPVAASSAPPHRRHAHSARGQPADQHDRREPPRPHGTTPNTASNPVRGSGRSSRAVRPVKLASHICPAVPAVTAQRPHARHVQVGDRAGRHPEQRGDLAGPEHASPGGCSTGGAIVCGFLLGRRAVRRGGCSRSNATFDRNNWAISVSSLDVNLTAGELERMAPTYESAVSRSARSIRAGEGCWTAARYSRASPSGTSAALGSWDMGLRIALTQPAPNAAAPSWRLR